MKRLGWSFVLVSLCGVVSQASSPLNVVMIGKTITPSEKIVRFELPSPGQEAATTTVFNLQGERVAELTAESLGRFYWDGNDVNRQPVSSGLYVVQIRHHGSVWHGPILVNR